MKAKRNIILASLTTLRAGGPARYFFSIKNMEDLKESVVFACEHGLPIFVLGGGSNVLISDKGFDGVVIKMEIDGIEFKNIENKKVRVIASAGVNWDTLVEKTVNKNLYGLENLSLIPGTVGAAPVQNIGAYGVEVKDTIEWVEVFDTETRGIKKLTNIDCIFGYRDSLFKKESGRRFIIIRVAFVLKLNGVINTSYKDLSEYFNSNEKPTIKEARKAIIKIRTRKLPDIKNVGTAGSFFKNPIINTEDVARIKNSYPLAPIYMSSKGKAKLSVAWLIDEVGKWKLVREKNIESYGKQPLVLVNHGENNAQELFNFAQKIKKDIKQKININLDFEVEVVGKFDDLL